MNLRTIFWILILGLFWVGCGGGETTPESLETIDIEPRIEIEIAEDQQAAPRALEFVGIMPDDFPNDMPLYLPSSLVDFGRDDGGRFVSLLSPHSPAKVRGALPALLRGGGWQMSGDLTAPEGVALRKDRMRLRLRVEQGNPGTVLRFIY